jgi:hypothetical protein
MSIPFEKSFASHEKSVFWSGKNENKPEEVFKSSNKKYVFDCKDCHHEFLKSLDKISIDGGWCPYCAIHSKVLCESENCMFCYKRSFASHEKTKYWSSNNDCPPRNVFKSSHKKYLFDCIDCKHVNNISLANVTKGNWCSYCSNQKLCDSGDCQLCFNKSFASHEKSEFFLSIENKCNPRDVFKSSGNKYKFNCTICNHIFEMGLNSVNNNTWCPYCANPSKLLCDSVYCMFCYNKSFASHEKSKYWSSKNDCKPRDVFKSSRKKYDFNCDLCYHTNNISLNNITSGNWCSYCSNQKLCNSCDCQLCFSKSFASNEEAIFWSSKNECQPRDVFKSSGNKYKFNCNKCNNEFLKALYNKTWCPTCSPKYSKCQIKWLNFISSYNQIQIQHAENEGEYIIPSTKYSADGYCQQTNTIYEFHGDFWHGNPKKFNPTDMNTIINKTYGELYEKTIKREQEIRDMGFNLVIMWESDWNKIIKSVRTIQKIFRKFK